MIVRMRLGVGCALALLASVGCGDQPETEPPPPPPPANACPSPNRLVGERCLEPGTQDDGCPAGTLGLIDGSCQPAGVPPELCAEGFAHDADAACEPILPAEACSKGQMAIPGENACHPVMPCGTGTWGAIPVDGGTVYVDGSYTGGASDGSVQRPWTTITEGIVAAATGALIAVAAGTYVGDVVVDKSVRLWGVCPDRVEIAGPATVAGVFFRPGSSGSELGGIAVTGPAIGIAISGAEDVHIEKVWVHDTLDRGVEMERTLGPTSLTLRSALIEQSHELGVHVSGSQLMLDGVVVRGTLPLASNPQSGRGVSVQLDPNASVATTAVVTRSLIEDNREHGVFVAGSEATLEGVVIRRTLPSPGSQLFGRGIGIQASQATGAPASVTVTSSLVEDNHDVGVLVAGSQATLEGVVVRGTLPDASSRRSGRGVGIQQSLITALPASALVARSLIEDNHDLGVFVAGSDLTLEGVVIRRTLPRASDQASGRGVAVQPEWTTGAPATAVVRGSLVEDNHDIGVVVFNADAAFEGIVVRRTAARASDQRFGRGILFELDPTMGALGTAVVKGSLVEDSHEVGVVVNLASATLEGLLVRATLPRASDGFFGDGVAVASAFVQSTPTAAVAVVTHSRIEKNARAGLGNFGAQVALYGNALSCNAVDLNGESVLGLSPSFDDLGSNGCGCPEATIVCAAKSSGLAPPDAIADPP